MTETNVKEEAKNGWTTYIENVTCKFNITNIAKTKDVKALAK